MSKLFLLVVIFLNIQTGTEEQKYLVVRDEQTCEAVKYIMMYPPAMEEDKKNNKKHQIKNAQCYEYNATTQKMFPEAK